MSPEEKRLWRIERLYLEYEMLKVSTYRRETPRSRALEKRIYEESQRFKEEEEQETRQ